MNLKYSFLLYFLIVNIISFISYGIDKYNSKKNKRRISERTLLILSLVGGVFGSIFAMNIFSHKTNVKKFIIFNYLLLIIYTILVFI